MVLGLQARKLPTSTISHSDAFKAIMPTMIGFKVWDVGVASAWLHSEQSGDLMLWLPKKP